MNFPLFDIQGNKLTSHDGEVSFFHEAFGVDLDQMTQEESAYFYEMVKGSLIRKSEESFTKVYSFGSQVFINSSCFELNLKGVKLIETDSSLECFLGGDLDSSIDFHEDFYILNGEYKRIISFKQLPLELGFSELQGLCDYVLILTKYEKLQAKAKLNFKRRIHLSSLFKNIKDIDSENAFTEAESLLEQVSNHEEALFDCAIYLIASSTTKEGLDFKTSELLKELKSIDSIPRIESRALQSIFLEIFPGSSPKLIRSHLSPASYVTALMPMNKELIHHNGVSFQSRSGKKLYHDIFHPNSHNFNVLISGESGQGKSMLANELLYHHQENGASSVVLDLGNSFLKNVKYLNGDVFSDSFNPMSFNDSEYLKEFILSFIDEPWGQIEQGRLLRTINEVKKEAKTFRDLIEQLSLDFHELELYFEGLWHHFNNEHQDISTLIYCDLSHYSDRLKRPLVIYLIECFKHQEGRRLFIFDECWDLLSNNGDYIAKCFRTFRKHDASAVAISQNIDDFANSLVGRAIIQNTFTKFLFKQKASDITFLSSYEKELINSVHSQKGEFSEFLILSEDIRKVVRLFTSRLRYELFTSDPKDNRELDFYMREKGKFFDFDRAIQNFTKIKYEGSYEY